MCKDNGGFNEILFRLHKERTLLGQPERGLHNFRLTLLGVNIFISIISGFKRIEVWRDKRELLSQVEVWNGGLMSDVLFRLR